MVPRRSRALWPLQGLGGCFQGLGFRVEGSGRAGAWTSGVQSLDFAAGLSDLGIGAWLAPGGL